MSVNKFRAGQFKDSDLVTETEFSKFDSYNNITLTQSGDTDVIVSATTNSPAALIINDGIRYNTANASVTLSGSSNTYSIFAIGDSSANKNFTLDFAVLGQTPAGATNYRKVGEAVWSGSAITSLTTHDDFISQGGNSSSDLPTGYINGLKVRHNNVSSVTVEAGKCRDDQDQNNIVLSSSLVINITTSGAGGLDTGAEASNTWYYVWLIKNSTTDAVSAILSASFTNPTMPSGYDIKRLLPIAIRNNNSSDFIDFYVSSWGKESEVFLMVRTDQGENQILNGGSSTTFAEVNASSLVPPIANTGIYQLRVNQNGSNSGTNGPHVFKGSGVGNGQGVHMTTNSSTFKQQEIVTKLISDDQKVQYNLNTSGNSAFIWVLGFVINDI